MKLDGFAEMRKKVVRVMAAGIQMKLVRNLLARQLLVERLRAYSLHQLGLLREYLADAGVDSVTGGDPDHGAFLSIRLGCATQLPRLLEEHRIICDARGDWLRLCPDCLTRDEELRRAAIVLGDLLHGRS